MPKVLLTCGYCGRGLSRKCCLKKHEEICSKNPNGRKLTCRYCGGVFYRKGPLAIHESSCLKNPNRVKRPRPSVVRQGKPRVCKLCGQTLYGRKSLSDHLHGIHKIKKRAKGGVCKLCGETYVNVRKHRKVCPARRHNFVGCKMPEETKRKISTSVKSWLKENPDKHPWKRKDKFVSKPCEFMKNAMFDDGYSFMEEFTDPSWKHSYSLDIAVLDKKIGIEVNGNQHYKRDGNLLPYYEQRHKIIEDSGWILLEIPCSYVYVKDKIDEIERLIDTSPVVGDEEINRLLTFGRGRKFKKE